MIPIISVTLIVLIILIICAFIFLFCRGWGIHLNPRFTKWNHILSIILTILLILDFFYIIQFLYDWGGRHDFSAPRWGWNYFPSSKGLTDIYEVITACLITTFTAIGIGFLIVTISICWLAIKDLSNAEYSRSRIIPFWITWLIIPPFWFFVEHFWIFPSMKIEGADFDKFKRGQDLAAQLWLTGVSLTSAVLYNVSLRASKIRNERLEKRKHKQKKNEYGWESRDGFWIFAKTHKPLWFKKIKKVVCLVHGLGEHSGRYEHVIKYLTNANYAVCTFDLRGHGNSEGLRGHSPSYKELMNDIENFVEYAKGKFPGKKYFLYGHSLGGNLVLNFVLKNKDQIDQGPKFKDMGGIIASSPALEVFKTVSKSGQGIKIGWIDELLLWFFDSLLPEYFISKERDLSTYISRDENEKIKYRKDPMVHNYLTCRLALDVIISGKYALKHAKKFSNIRKEQNPMPLLVMHGDEDKITSFESSQKFTKEVGENCCSFKNWNGFYHELHNEPRNQMTNGRTKDKGSVLEIIVKWLDEQVSS